MYLQYHYDCFQNKSPRIYIPEVFSFIKEKGNFKEIFYFPQRTCGIVMLLHLSVIYSVHRGDRGVWRTPLGQIPLPRADTYPRERLVSGRHPYIPPAEILFLDTCLSRPLQLTIRILLECFQSVFHNVDFHIYTYAIIYFPGAFHHYFTGSDQKKSGLRRKRNH